MAKKSTKLPTIKVPSAKPDDQPATRGMLKSVSGQLHAEINQVRFDLKKDIADVKRDISEVKSMVHRSNLLVEEQNANNRIVLEGLQALWQRQADLEKVSAAGQR